MATRRVVPTADSLLNGKPVPRAYIAQLDEHFLQFFANMIAEMDTIVNDADMPANAKVNAAKEMRYIILEQKKLVDEIEARQDRQESADKSNNLRRMVAEDPFKALRFIQDQQKQLKSFEDFLNTLISTRHLVDSIASQLPSVDSVDDVKEVKLSPLDYVKSRLLADPSEAMKPVQSQTQAQVLKPGPAPNGVLKEKIVTVFDLKDDPLESVFGDEEYSGPF